MPPLNQSIANDEKRLRIFAYGREKCKKTLWAAGAAEAGFNVFIVNGEPGGTQILRLIKEEAKARVQVVDACNTVERNIFSMFVALMCRPGNAFTWDEQTKSTVPGLRNIEHSFYEINPSKFTLNDVVVIDSWTTLAQSVWLQYAKEHDIDLSDAEKTEWDGFGFEGRFLDFVLNQISAWPCHLIVIGHSIRYEKWKGQGRDRVLVSSTIQPISSSGPHAAKVGNKFNDVLTFDRVSSEVFTIDTGGSKDSIGGSRLIAPGVHRWTDLPVQKFFDAIGCKPTGEPCRGAVWIAPGTEQVLPQSAKVTSLASKVSPQPALVSKPQQPVLQTGGLAARLKMKGN